MKDQQCGNEILENSVTSYRKLAQSTQPIQLQFSIKDFFSKCDQIRSFQQIWSYLLKKPLMENFIFCAVIFMYFRVYERFYHSIIKLKAFLS